MTGPVLWHLLWRLHFDAGALANLPCDCTSGPCSVRPDGWIHLGEDLPGGQWSACPHGMLRHPMLAAAIQVHNWSSISPLSQWPDTYCSAVVDCLCAYRIESEKAAQAKRAKTA